MKAQQYAVQWNTFATASGHITSTYNPESSQALIYNLYADRLLNFGLVHDAARFLPSLPHYYQNTDFPRRYMLHKQTTMHLFSPTVYSVPSVLPQVLISFIRTLGPTYGLPTDDETRIGRSRTCCAAC
jgi:hypothetical protein